MSQVCYLVAFVCFLLALLGLRSGVNLELLGWLFISLGLMSPWAWPWWPPRP